MEKIISLFTIASLDHEFCPKVKIRYLAGDPALFKCNLLDLSGLISSKETRQQALQLPSSTPLATANRMSDAQAQPPPTGPPQPCIFQTTTTPSPMDFPPPRGFPWKFIAKMVHFDMSCPVYQFNKPNDSPCLNFYQEVGCTDLEKRKDSPVIYHGIGRHCQKTQQEISKDARPTLPHQTWS